MNTITQEIIQSPKVGHAVAAITATAGTSTWMDWIPSDIGKLVSLVGLVLTVVLIRLHWQSLKNKELENVKLKLEIENLKSG